MSTELILLVIYLIIGIVIAIYDWNKYHKEDYEKYKEKNEAEDEMAVMYLVGITIFWPIIIRKYLFLKK